MALGETLTFGIRQERAVVELRYGPLESSIQENLAKGGLDEVRPANNFGHPHRVVVDHARELVTGNVILSPD